MVLVIAGAPLLRVCDGALDVVLLERLAGDDALRVRDGVGRDEERERHQGGEEDVEPGVHGGCGWATND